MTRLLESGGQDSASDPSERSPHLLAMEEALEATRTYGATSKEARVAWEIAEEIEDSIFSPCSKRCDPLPRSEAPTSDSAKEELPPLFADNNTMNTKEDAQSKVS